MTRTSGRVPRSRWQRLLLHALGDAFVLGGIARGVTHFGQGKPPDDLVARAALFREGP